MFLQDARMQMLEHPVEDDEEDIRRDDNGITQSVNDDEGRIYSTTYSNEAFKLKFIRSKNKILKI